MIDAFKSSNCEIVLVIIEDEPIRETFDYLNLDDILVTREIWDYIEKIKWSIKKSREGITEDSINRYQSNLRMPKNKVLSFKLQRSEEKDDYPHFIV